MAPKGGTDTFRSASFSEESSKRLPPLTFSAVKGCLRRSHKTGSSGVSRVARLWVAPSEGNRKSETPTHVEQPREVTLFFLSTTRKMAAEERPLGHRAHHAYSQNQQFSRECNHTCSHDPPYHRHRRRSLATPSHPCAYPDSFLAWSTCAAASTTRMKLVEPPWYPEHMHHANLFGMYNNHLYTHVPIHKVTNQASPSVCDTTESGVGGWEAGLVQVRASPEVRFPSQLLLYSTRSLPQLCKQRQHEKGPTPPPLHYRLLNHRLRQTRPFYVCTHCGPSSNNMHQNTQITDTGTLAHLPKI